MAENDATDLRAHCRQALGQDPTLQVVEFNHRWYTWGELQAVADKVNVHLDQATVDPRAPIGFIPRSRPSAIAAELGLMASGRTIRMIYSFQSATRVAHDLERFRLSAVVAAPEDLGLEALAVIRQQGMAAVVIREMDAGAVPGADRCTAVMDPDAPTSPTIEVLTSGTTGTPKHVRFSYEMIHEHMVKPVAAFVGQVNPLFMPISNLAGIMSVIPTMLSGARAVLYDRFTLDGWRDYVRRFKPTRGGLPPAGIRMILDADVPLEEISCLKSLHLGSAALDPAVQIAFEDRYGIPIIAAYGATEFAGTVASMSLELHAKYGRAKVGSVGRAAFGASLRVVDSQTGEELPKGQEGVLEVIPPRTGTNWFRTTDIAVIDEDGFLFLRGRADGAINRGGFKVLPETIERALLLHSSISFAAVVDVPDDRLGQVPAAAIQLKPDVEPVSVAELEQHLRDHVLATHIPTKWLFVSDLPRTVSYKVDLNGVRSLFLDAQPKQGSAFLDRQRFQDAR